jgi:hypothetical protein
VWVMSDDVSERCYLTRAVRVQYNIPDTGARSRAAALISALAEHECQKNVDDNEEWTLGI